MDFPKIEEKWLKRWEDAKIFESDPDTRERFYLTVAYPYPSGGMHIGHTRTYTVPDVIARFKRMQGFNVMFPMAWHVTGTPIIGALKRLREGEEKQLKVFKEVYGVSDEDIAKMQSPMDYAQYFIESHYRNSMKRLGYAIDWRRQFTTADPHYNAFITWQYKSLHSRGLIRKGLHPVKYCTKDENPVTTHDLLEGDSADVQEFTLLKFKFGDEYIIAATLRPETVFGQTNMWVGPDITYVKAKVGDEVWIVSRECADKLKLQGNDVKIVGEVNGSDLLGKFCTAPGIDRDIIILPSQFCDPKVGAGLVTSVPSDAPYDWMGLTDLKENRKLCERYGLNQADIKKIEVIPIIGTEEFGDAAALKVCEDMGIKNQTEHRKLKEATQLVYKTGFHKGVMLPSCGKYKGMAVARAKDKVKEELLDEGKASTMLEFSDPVVCRCGGEVVVAKAESWFVDYGNEDWKEVVSGCIEQMNFIPARTRKDYLNTVDWLREWPCIRNYGLGTKLPFDDRFTIEPLSDSTIYMAYYTIVHQLSDLKPEQLTEEFFNFIFKNEGKLEEVAKKTKIPKQKIAEIKKSFDYYYPQNWRCSALELIQNHLTFMIYHHVALFLRDRWPEGIATFGMGLLEGEKMSSSKGNVILAKEAVERHGADVVRLYLMGLAEPWQDFDWREAQVENVKGKINVFYDLCSGDEKGDAGKLRPIDRWLLSRMQKTIRYTTEALEGFQTRKALQSAFYGVLNDLNWYNRRAPPNPKVLSEVKNVWVRLMSPFTPFVCEELWEKMGGKGFVSCADYPLVDEGKVDEGVEASESLIQSIMEDVKNILDVVKKRPQKIFLYVAPAWKRKVFELIKEGKGMKDIMADSEIKKHGKEVVKLAKLRPDEIPEVMLSSGEEVSALQDAADFLGKTFNAQITVHEKPDHDPEGKSKHSQPMKPGIYFE